MEYEDESMTYDKLSEAFVLYYVGSFKEYF